MKGNTLSAAINKKYRFVLKINENFQLNYAPKELRWSEFKKNIDTNVKTLEVDVNEYWKGYLISPWVQLQNAVKKLTKSAAELKDSEESSAEDELDRLMSSMFNIFSRVVEKRDGYEIFIFSIDSISVKDKGFSKVEAFMNWASKRCLEWKDTCDSQDAVSVLVSTIKNPSLAYRDLTSQQAHNRLPALWALKHELSVEHDLSDFVESIVSASKLQLEESSKALTEADEDFRGVFSTLTSDMGEFKEEIDSWKTTQQQEIDHLENLYREKLALEEPKKIWDCTAKQHMKRAFWWTIGAVLAAIFTLGGGSYAIHWLYTAKLPKIPLLSSSFLAIAIITFCVYTIRVFVKLALSNSHLAAAYEQKAAMTYFYLSLMEKEKAVSDEERALILNSLFSSIDTGLVKPSDNKDLESLAAIAFKRT